MYIASATGLAWLAQEQGGFTIPWVVWVVLGIILTAVVLGWILGERTSVRNDPRSYEEPQVIPETGQEDGGSPAIPQTGGETVPVEIPAQALDATEGPVNDQDLTLIAGIDPAIQRVLYDAGITTYLQLSRVNINDLRAILDRSAVPHTDPAGWPDQARLAASGRFNEMEGRQPGTGR